MKKSILFLSLLTITFFVTSCEQGINKDSKVDNSIVNIENENSDVEKNITVDFENVDISDVENEKLYQYIVYPITTINKNTNLNVEIKKMNEHYKNDAEEFKKINKLDVREFFKKAESDDNRYYYYEVFPSVVSNDDKYLSLMMRTEVDLLGAHGSYTIEGWNFDKRTGKKLRIFDIVKSKDDLKNFLLSWCEENSENIYFFDEYKEIIESYINDEYEMQFVIENGIVSVIFQVYDIAPYAQGAIEIILDDSIIK